MRKRLFVVLVAAAALAMGPGTVQAQGIEEIQAIIREAAGRHGVSGDRLVQVARCESRFITHAVGRAGEQGLFQLHPSGLRRTFLNMGYGDPFNAWEASDFTAWAFAHGLSSHWTCAR